MLSKWAEVFVVHNGRLPQRDDQNELLPSFLFWILHNITKTITGSRNNYFGNYGLLRFLKKKIDIVLANYGIAGAHVLPVCRSACVPLVVHFHGFDATEKKVLETYIDAYRSMFYDAAASVVVSVDMKQQLMTLGAPEKKIAMIPYGIDVKKFAFVCATTDGKQRFSNRYTRCFIHSSDRSCSLFFVIPHSPAD